MDKIILTGNFVTFEKSTSNLYTKEQFLKCLEELNIRIKNNQK